MQPIEADVYRIAELASVTRDSNGPCFPLKGAHCRGGCTAEQYRPPGYMVKEEEISFAVDNVTAQASSTWLNHLSVHLLKSGKAPACQTAECAFASNTNCEVRHTAGGLLMPLWLPSQMFSDLFRDSETIRAHHIMLNKNPNIRVGEWLEGTRRVAFLTTYQAPAWVKKLIRELLCPPTLQCHTCQDMGIHELL